MLGRKFKLNFNLKDNHKSITCVILKYICFIVLLFTLLVSLVVVVFFIVKKNFGEFVNSGFLFLIMLILSLEVVVFVFHKRFSHRQSKS